MIKNLFWKLTGIIPFSGALYLMKNNSMLSKNGWFKSLRYKESINNKMEPIPWCTYTFIKFIENRLNKNMDVFEFGSGNSTLYYSKFVNEITAVEHNLSWYNKMTNLSKKINNIKLIFQNSSSDYPKSILTQDKLFDIIIIDAIERVECAKNSILKLKKDGIIIFDNSDLEEYEPAFDNLFNHGFKRLDFYGFSPISSTENCTSIFYKVDNCLKI